jgi:protoporphyrin/coproporphyrin ferrochelatase
MGKKGILLVNLGTPDSPSTANVRKYLKQFLMDGRVIDVNPVLRNILVKGVIVPFRGPKSAKLYQEIWSDETGSPLMHYSILQAKALQTQLGDDYHVELAMRYQSPSIKTALTKLKNAQVNSIKVIPMFPHYASASTGSVMQDVMQQISQWLTIPPVSFVNSFYNHPLMIKTFAQNGAKYQPENYDYILFSFHGLPQRQLVKSDHSQQHCQKNADCCKTITENNKFCYSAQCYNTAQLIAQALQIPKDKYTVCFQSRLGKTPWVQPYTNEILKDCATKGHKKLLVFCPAFVADCLETVYEVTVEYGDEFKEMGGQHLQLVESLNDNPLWIAALEDIVLNG